MKQVKVTHRSNGKPYPLKRSYNHSKPSVGPQHATHSKGSKKSK